MHLVISFLINAASLWLITYINKGIHYDTVTALLIAAVVLGVVNAIIRPIALLLSLPFIVLTLGIFALVVNGLCLWLVGAVVPGFHVDGFWAAFWGAVELGIISWIVTLLGIRKIGEQPTSAGS